MGSGGKSDEGIPTPLLPLPGSDAYHLAQIPLVRSRNMAPSNAKGSGKCSPAIAQELKETGL